MKQPIYWHKRNLENRKAYAARRREEFEELKSELFDLDQENSFLSYQIEEAEKAGKDSFDPDKYKVQITDPSKVLVHRD
jgi:uncharacterized protein (DUF3084 family)